MSSRSIWLGSRGAPLFVAGILLDGGGGGTTECWFEHRNSRPTNDLLAPRLAVSPLPDRHRSLSPSTVWKGSQSAGVVYRAN